MLNRVIKHSVISACLVVLAANATCGQEQPTPKRSWQRGHVVRVCLDYFTLPGLTHERSVAHYEQACRTWGQVCSIRFDTHASFENANIVPTIGPIDGPSVDGKLTTAAISQIPPWVGTPGTRRLYQWFDSAETFSNERVTQSIVLHELGHAIGLDHLGPTNVMAPECTGRTWPSIYDAAEAAARYPVARTPKPKK